MSNLSCFRLFQVFFPAEKTILCILGNEVFVWYGSHPVFFGKVPSSEAHENIRRYSSEGKRLTTFVQNQLGKRDGVFDAYIGQRVSAFRFWPLICGTVG